MIDMVNPPLGLPLIDHLSETPLGAEIAKIPGETCRIDVSRSKREVASEDKLRGNEHRCTRRRALHPSRMASACPVSVRYFGTINA